MSLFKSQSNSRDLHHVESRSLSHQELQDLGINNQLEKLAIPLAQTWKDDHPDAQLDSEEDLDSCILAVAIEMSVAGEAVGGPVGAVIASGGGVAAASVVCRRVL